MTYYSTALPCRLAICKGDEEILQVRTQEGHTMKDKLVLMVGLVLVVLALAWSNASRIPGMALWVKNNNIPTGIAPWVQANGSGMNSVVGNRCPGPLIEGFGGDGGEDELRDGDDGIIGTKADSYIFVPGNLLREESDSPVVLDSLPNGAMEVEPAGLGGFKYVNLPIQIPAVLYGKGVKIEEVTVYYRCKNSASYIDQTQLLGERWTPAYPPYTIIADETDRTSTGYYASYALTPAAPNVLTPDYGILNLRFKLYFLNLAFA